MPDAVLAVSPELVAALVDLVLHCQVGGGGGGGGRVGWQAGWAARWAPRVAAAPATLQHPPVCREEQQDWRPQVLLSDSVTAVHGVSSPDAPLGTQGDATLMD